jgi:hypothetical protein
MIEEKEGPWTNKRKLLRRFAFPGPEVVGPAGPVGPEKPGPKTWSRTSDRRSSPEQIKKEGHVEGEWWRIAELLGPGDIGAVKA